jgi:hypothetical protein
MTSDMWGSKVLQSVTPVVEGAKHVAINNEKLLWTAQWMAYEEFIPSDGSLLFDFGNDPDVIMDFQMVLNTMNFAFTDFQTGVKFEADYLGRRWSDSEAVVACVHRALSAGIPFLSGDYLATVTRNDLEQVFAGTIEMPMLDDRVELFNAAGQTLVEKYQGRYANFVRSCAPRLYANGEGLLDRLPVEFPRFEDASNWHGSTVYFYKLAQLGIWSTHLALSPRGLWALEDPHMISAFADYIVPVGLRVMGVFEYSPALEAKIMSGKEITANSDEEIELRASSIYAIARLTDEINALRPGMTPLLQPQVDYRFWKSYHATHFPHHLTFTRMY